jgi:hypothetical protein
VQFGSLQGKPYFGTPQNKFTLNIRMENVLHLVAAMVVRVMTAASAIQEFAR